MKPSRELSTWLAILVLAGTGTVQAQEKPTGEPATPPELTPPPLVPVPPPGEQGTPPKPRPRPGEEEAPKPAPPVSPEAAPSVDAAVPPEDPVPRVAVEVLGGIGGGVVAGTVGLAAGYLLGAPTVGCNECRVTALVGGFAGVVLGIPAGTWLGGKVMGGQGRFFSTVAGSAVGWGGALLGTLLLNADDDDDAVALVLLALPVAGATAGYELSHAAQRQTPAVQVLPVAGFGQRGPRLGLMGRF